MVRQEIHQSNARQGRYRDMTQHLSLGGCKWRDLSAQYFFIAWMQVARPQRAILLYCVNVSLLLVPQVGGCTRFLGAI